MASVLMSFSTGFPDLTMKRSDINGKGLCNGGAMISEAIWRNTRGENPDVPMGVLSRFPMLNKVQWLISTFHFYCAVVLMVVIYTNFIGPKGNDPKPSKAKFHMYVGRVFSWIMAPHYAIVGLVLNYYVVTVPKPAEWLLGMNLTGWRSQMAYITPFGLNVLCASFMGFFLNRYTFMSGPIWIFALKAVCVLSMVWWFTIGVYMLGSPVLGLGLGAFGLPIEQVLDGGGKYTTENEAWFTTIAYMTFSAGFAQAGFDYVNYKCLCVMGKSGFKELAWKDMHKWTMLNLTFQAGFIFGFFVAVFPFCAFGFPEWTCLRLYQAIPVSLLFIWPVFVNLSWITSFIKALLGGEIKKFSKGNHKWDRTGLTVF